MGFGQIEDRMANLRIRENHSPKTNGINGYHGAVNGHGMGQNRFPNGKPFPPMNGVRRTAAPMPHQRLPTDDDFPVLQGSLKGSPSPAPPVALGGLTAAQVLQAPPPKKDSVTQNGKAESSSGQIPNGDHCNGAPSPSAPEVTVLA